MLKPVTCTYCGNEAELVMGDVVYPSNKRVHHKHFWLCEPCDAWVACHENSPSLKPIGHLANKELREAKREVHRVFDVLWQSGYLRHLQERGDFASKSLCTGIAYKWLAERIGIPARNCHIGVFTIEQCRQAVKICENLGNELLLKYK